MRSFIFLCLLATTLRGHAAIATTQPLQNQLESPGIHIKKHKQHSKPFMRFVAKRLAKIPAVSPGQSYGVGSAIAGLACAVLVLASSLFFPFNSAAIALLLVIAGLILSIIGFIRASQYNRNRLAKRIALAGLILNSIFIVSFLLAVLFAFK